MITVNDNDDDSVPASPPRCAYESEPCRVIPVHASYRPRGRSCERQPFFFLVLAFFLSIGVQSTFAIIILLLHPLFRVTQVLIVDFGESRALLLDFLDDLLIAYCTRILIPGSYLACLPCLYPSNFDFDFELETQTGGSSAAEPS
jgi:hypothetical protein